MPGRELAVCMRHEPGLPRIWLAISPSGEFSNIGWQQSYWHHDATPPNFPELAALGVS